MKRSSPTADSNRTSKKICTRKSSSSNTALSPSPVPDSVASSNNDTSVVIDTKNSQQQQKQQDSHAHTTIQNTEKSSPSNRSSESRSPDPRAPETTCTTPAAADNTNMSVAVLDHIQDIIVNLDKGRIDYCLSNRLTGEKLDKLDSKNAELATSLDAALKNIAQRQLQLETENLRYRIAIQQQHQILTCHQPEDHHRSATANSFSQEDDVPLPTSTVTTTTTTTAAAAEDDTKEHDAHMTPEDGIPSVKDSSMIDILQTTVHPVVSLSSSTGNF